ncbi:MAG: hypothetical protein K2W96_22955 [Gemmataceae bacterium]|nr:hypothetical protein [Gemmataceae bacterium]
MEEWQVRSWLRQLLDAGAGSVKACRAEVVRTIGEQADPAEALLELVRTCESDGGAEGEILGIDTVAEAGPLALAAAKRFVAEDSPRWPSLGWLEHRPENGQAHILLGGLARAMPGEDEALILIIPACDAPNRDLRIAAAQALEALAHAESKERLERMLGKTEDALLRGIVTDALADLEA